MLKCAALRTKCCRLAINADCSSPDKLLKSPFMTGASTRINALLVADDCVASCADIKNIKIIIAATAENAAQHNKNLVLLFKPFNCLFYIRIFCV